MQELGCFTPCTMIQTMGSHGHTSSIMGGYAMLSQDTSFVGFLWLIVEYVHPLLIKWQQSDSRTPLFSFNALPCIPTSMLKSIYRSLSKFVVSSPEPPQSFQQLVI